MPRCSAIASVVGTLWWRPATGQWAGISTSQALSHLDDLVRCGVVQRRVPRERCYVMR